MLTYLCDTVANYEIVLGAHIHERQPELVHLLICRFARQSMSMCFRSLRITDPTIEITDYQEIA